MISYVPHNTKYIWKLHVLFQAYILYDIENMFEPLKDNIVLQCTKDKDA